MIDQAKGNRYPSIGSKKRHLTSLESSRRGKQHNLACTHRYSRRREEAGRWQNMSPHQAARLIWWCPFFLFLSPLCKRSPRRQSGCLCPQYRRQQQLCTAPSMAIWAQGGVIILGPTASWSSADRRCLWHPPSISTILVPQILPPCWYHHIGPLLLSLSCAPRPR